MRPADRSALFRLPLAFAAVAVVALICWLPVFVIGPHTGSAIDRLKAQNDFRTTLLQALAGAVVLIGTARTLHLNREGQITDRFTRAIDQLGSEKLEVRLGGIYALERVARNSRTDHGPVVEVLTAFLREHARGRPEPGGNNRVAKHLRADIHAAATVLSRREIGHEAKGFRLNLAEVDLQNASLAGARLDNANLQKAQLDGADLEGARLSGADLWGARLRGARLAKAELAGVMANGVHLEGADLREADLTEATMQGASAAGAFLAGADMRRADLRHAILDGADLKRAHLDAANLNGARVRGADVTGAAMCGADLRDADLAGTATLSVAQVEDAITNDRTRLPRPTHPAPGAGAA
jgi:uncharacterized protein YjbI with pentapeptide repeats